MKTAICYFSRCHGNTLKVARAMAEGQDVDLIDVTARTAFYLEQYDVIGFASGIYYGKFHESILHFARQYLPPNKNVFFLYTGGAPKPGNADAIKAAVADRQAVVLGQYFCRGYDTFGPFKLVGGIAKGHPNEEELQQAREFFQRVILGCR